MPLKTVSVSLLLALTIAMGVPIAATNPPSTASLRAGTVCNNTFALCNMAPCVLIPTQPLMLQYDAPFALCSCTVLTTWNIGPGSCTDRNPKKMGKNGRTYLLSTFSNAFNNKAKALECAGANKGPWTNCYGAPCVIDSSDSSKAVCTCTVEPASSFDTFGGGCDKTQCKRLWSGSSLGLTLFGSKILAAETRKKDPSYSGPGISTICRRV